MGLHNRWQTCVAVCGLVLTEADVKECWLRNVWGFPGELEQGGRHWQERLVSLGNQLNRKDRIGSHRCYFQNILNSRQHDTHICSGFHMLIVTFWLAQRAAQYLDFHLGKHLIEEETRDSPTERNGYFGLKFISKSYTFTFLEMQVEHTFALNHLHHIHPPYSDLQHNMIFSFKDLQSCTRWKAVDTQDADSKITFDKE